MIGNLSPFSLDLFLAVEMNQYHLTSLDSLMVHGTLEACWVAWA